MGWLKVLRYFVLNMNATMHMGLYNKCKCKLLAQRANSWCKEPNLGLSMQTIQ